MERERYDGVETYQVKRSISFACDPFDLIETFRLIYRIMLNLLTKLYANNNRFSFGMDKMIDGYAKESRPKDKRKIIFTMMKSEKYKLSASADLFIRIE